MNAATDTRAAGAEQSALERRVLEALMEYARDVGPAADGPLGLRAGSAGPACLHLAAEPFLTGYLLHRLCPVVLGAGERLAGLPGLRLVSRRPGRLELRRREGRGRIFLHLDAAAERALADWDRDRVLVYGGGRCVPGATALVPCNDLRERPGLHPCEQAALCHAADRAADAPASEELRRLVRRLPALPGVHDHR
ncbi:hypothetical protein AB0P32_31255 [Streptomyces sp. NPDC085995]|uniref:hypothetical protein n=1 Tax=Streptomyces sp. NPDC085995 TaxID=3154861 RepID=UPI00344A56A3